MVSTVVTRGEENADTEALLRQTHSTRQNRADWGKSGRSYFPARSSDVLPWASDPKAGQRVREGRGRRWPGGAAAQRSARTRDGCLPPPLGHGRSVGLLGAGWPC